MSLYRYVGNAPVNLIDPSGQVSGWGNTPSVWWEPTAVETVPVIKSGPTLGEVQVFLGVLGFFPVLGAGPDLINSGIDFAQGDKGSGAVNLIAAIPFWGDGVKAVKILNRGMNNPVTRTAVERGKQAHREFADKVKEKPGWLSQPTIKGPNGETLYPDVIDPKGRPVELKPNTPSGRERGAKQIEKYKEATGTNGRVIYYDP